MFVTAQFIRDSVNSIDLKTGGGQTKCCAMSCSVSFRPVVSPSSVVKM
jgi:hypothetical protein